MALEIAHTGSRSGGAKSCSSHFGKSSRPAGDLHTISRSSLAQTAYRWNDVRKRIAVCATSTTPLRELTCHMGSHSVTCHPAEVKFPPLPQPIKAGTRFSDPRGMQGWVDLVGLVTYRGGIPAQRRSPIPTLTGLNVEQLRSYDERRYHSAKPYWCVMYNVKFFW